MSAKTSAARRRAFFVALAETGNQTLAAERARVSRSWVTLHRMSNPAFQAGIDAAIATAKARLDGATSVKPQPRWRGQDGEELTVRGSRGRWTQVARTRLKQWTPRTEARFLRSLTANCNVKLACREVGLSQASAYNHRNRWVGFAERWDAAIENGYDALAAALVNSACAMLGDETALPDPVMEPISVDQAIQLLLLHQRRAIGGGCRPGRVARLPSIDTVRAVILRKVAVFERAERREKRCAPDAE